MKGLPGSRSSAAMTVEERQTKRAKKAMIMEDFAADMIVIC